MALLERFFCFLSSAISPSAKEADKAPPPLLPIAPQNSTEPVAPPQSQVKTPDQPNSKDGEAAAAASGAKLAVDRNNETVQRIEAFYANTVHDFETHFSIAMAVISFVVAAMGALGVAAVLIIAKQTAEGQANKVLEPIKTWHSQLASQSTQLADQSATMYLT